ncbi:MAG: SMC-Scp complex subunit ScpB [Candidatus Micrarchaeia archaeon]
MEEPAEVKEAEAEMQELSDELEKEQIMETIRGEEVSSKSIEEIEHIIEAALFMSARPLSIFDLLKLTSATLKEVKTAIQNLQRKYAANGSWIEIVKDGKSYLMRLQPSKVGKVESITQETELSKRALRVLAVVAQNDGILQSKVSKKLGSTTYDGVKELVEKGYVIAEQKGHSKILRVSNKFKTYFGSSAPETLKRVKERESAHDNAPTAGETKSVADKI